MADPRKIDRLPPNAEDAEKGVLGCILLSPVDCLSECVEKFKAGASVFYDLRHQIIWSALLEFERPDTIDTITVHQKLKDAGKLDDVGGLAYLSSLPDAVPSAANLSYYADIVLEKYTLRKIIQVATNAVTKAYDCEGSTSMLLDEFEREVLSIRTTEKTSTPPIKQLVKESMAHIQQMFERKGEISGLSTGLLDLDKETDGLHPGEDIIIAAYSSGGKSSLAMNIAEHVAINLKKPVGVFTLEMTGVSLVTRSICSQARVNLRNIRDGFMSERDFPKIANSVGRISNAPLYFDDSSDMTIGQLRAKARRMKQQHGIELLVVDYLQLVIPEGGGGESREREVSKISNGIKQMAKELQVPVLCLSQLNDDGKLRESRAIGMDADGVWIMEPTDPEQVGGASYPVDLWIRKQRSGPRNVKIPLTFLAEFTRFEMRSKIESD